MKGLLLKDWYTLIKQMKIMLMLMLVFACVPGYSMAAFAVVYAAMLPVTALAYDERSKWDELAAMLPYSVREIVGGKYVLGVTAVAAAGAVAAVAQLILSRFGWTQFDAGGGVRAAVHGLPCAHHAGDISAGDVQAGSREGASALHDTHLCECRGGGHTLRQALCAH